MIIVTSSPSNPCFSATVQDLVFSITNTRAAVVIKVDDEVVYSETLYPVDGNITVSDLSGMFANYAERRLAVVVEIGITEFKVEPGGTMEILGTPYQMPDSVTTIGTTTLSFLVLFCSADLGVSASEFYSNYFLSILMGPKVTAIGRLEYLHYYGTDEASCSAVYSDGTTETFTPQVSGGNSRYTQLDVSPEYFVKEGKTLVSYTVTAGNRKQQFDIDLTKPDCAPILAFDNSFGVQELLYCTGTHKVSPEYKRQSARFGGMLRNYDIEETRTFSADTGILTTPMANWADELFRSKKVYLFNIYDGVPTQVKEVVITDCKSENANDDDYMPRFTFQYQYAQRIHNVVELKREGRIFDNTFDSTFN